MARSNTAFGRRVKPEGARKLVHMALGVFIATWPFYLSYQVVIILALVLLVAIVMARNLNIFSYLRSVHRASWGDIMFPIGVIIAALLQPPAVIFTIAILHLALADAAAAIVGTYKPLKPHKYKVFGQTKSVEGTLAFGLVSFFILLGALIFAPSADFPLALIFVLPVLAAATENIGVYGLDNALVPVLVTVILSSLRVG